MVKSAYIHIPFCTTICSYCDFCKMFYHERMVDEYLVALEKEIFSRYRNEMLKTIYIGGGTPSCLSLKQLEKLLQIITILKREEICEITFEMNVSDINEEKLKLLQAYGINRISIGIETINEKFFAFLNRFYSVKDAKSKINLAKKYFSNINVDLMYAFKGETLLDLEKDLNFIASLDVEHISIYSLILEEHTLLSIKKVEPIEEELDEEMYSYIIKRLKEMGYVHYEISNFAKNEFYYSKHNLVYWNNEEYYGFGLSASGYLNSIRYSNTRGFTSYLKGDYTLEEEVIDQDKDMEYEMILGLRKIEGVDRNVFFRKFQMNIEDFFDIMNLIEKKMMIVNDNRVYIPEDKLYISNQILIHFLRE